MTNVIQLPGTSPGTPVFQIVIDGGVWHRRQWVGVEPRRADWPSRAFPDEEAALAYAHQLHERTGWPILDRTAPQPPRAA